MKHLYLVINSGSSTYKYSLFDDEKKIAKVFYEKKSNKEFSKKIGDQKTRSISKKNFENSFDDFLKTPSLKKFFKEHTLKKIGFRFVHVGHSFSKTTRITNSILKKLSHFDELAPLHNPPARKLIEQVYKHFPKIPQFLFFDTSFHHSIPEKNWRYALSKKLADQNKIRKYGFHGLVCASIVRKLQQKKQLPKHLIICHLGSGCSITAIKDGKSLQTSMGFTPLEGLMMTTRAGDMDPGILSFLLKTKKFSVQKISDTLHFESGLKGITGTRDMRKILKEAQKNNPDAELALEMFCQRVAEYIARYLIQLGDLDLLVFSGGIGENAPEIRERICRLLKPLSVKIKRAKNLHAQEGDFFNSFLSSVKTCWIRADEDEEIYLQLLQRK